MNLLTDNTTESNLSEIKSNFLLRQLISSLPDSGKGAISEGEIKLNLKNLPYFRGHSFQDLTVLPGSAFIEMAAVIYYNRFNRLPYVIKNISFGSLTILSEEDVVIRYTLKNLNGNTKIIEFFTGDSFSTIVEIGESESQAVKSQTGSGFIEEFIKNAAVRQNSDEFYERLKADGNQFSGEFRGIKEVWINGSEALGRLEFTKSSNGRQFIIDPVKLDAFTQMITAVSRAEGRTFILSEITEIIIHNHEFPDNLWCRARLNKNTDNEFECDLVIFDDNGSLNIILSGVKIKYMEKVRESPGSICISSTFTAEPLEDSLKYWSSFFEQHYDISFAPYNQVFQELLDPNSLLSLNKRGFNVILLNPEDWIRKEHKLAPIVSHDEMENIFNDKSRFLLPNRTEIVHLNKYETEYLYKEIFIDKSYLKHGISINDGDTVIDIGANIGLFTLFVSQQCKNPSVFSFEPSPVVYDLLKRNMAVYGSNVKTFNCGVADKEKTAEFTFYKNSSVFSSFNADEAEDREAIRAVVKNMLSGIAGESGSQAEDYVNQLTAGRLEKSTYECKLISVSDIIKQNDIKKIDLLKIDAEKSEADIIRGIGDEDWEIIKQIVIEIHDKSGEILVEIKKILTDKGFSIAVEEEEMLKGSGLYNLFARKNTETNILSEADNKLLQNTEDFYNALEAFTARSPVPTIIVITPRFPNISAGISDPGIDRYENELMTRINGLPEVYTISTSQLLSAYGKENYYDPLGYELGHITYTLPFFGCIGTAIFRLIFSLQNPPRKVIALDCDNTLWKGVCGEDGPFGITISDAHKNFQQFLVGQMKAGMLLCLCTKNNEEDVLEVFRKRDDMVLKTDHLVSWRMNWEDKSSNLKSLAAELNLGLDSIIMIDDNPVECAAIKEQCPDVITLQLPAEDEKIDSFLKNTWVFDHIKITDEDKKRTKMYQENVRREKYRSSSLTLKDFLTGLDLQIRLSEPQPSQISRVSQLTFRTNQFNLTTIRRSEQEIREFLSDNNNGCLIADVSDRFGDYGTVGVLLYSRSGTSFKVDTFLLSCRVLGRGVEFKILSELGGKALSEGIGSVELKYLPTAKNQPALNFIKKVGSQFIFETRDQVTAALPADYLAELNYETFLDNSITDVRDEKSGPVKSIKYSGLSEKIQTITDDLSDAAFVFKKIEESKSGSNIPERKNIVLPGNDIEAKLTLIWCRVIGTASVSTDDNFLEIGGNSLKAVQLIASIKKEMNINISVVDLFECPTIRLLADKINSKNQEKASGNTGRERGSRRRDLIASRRSK